ncbi:MAG: hypothetical protein H0X18_15505 [Geodermatophilaceae bacterium]|nr:hypothetical protein [Geodermatophilaceae bacterium]
MLHGVQGISRLLSRLSWVGVAILMFSLTYDVFQRQAGVGLVAGLVDDELASGVIDHTDTPGQVVEYDFSMAQRSTGVVSAQGHSGRPVQPASQRRRPPNPAASTVVRMILNGE